MSTVQVVAFLASVSASLAHAGKPPAEPDAPEARKPAPAKKPVAASVPKTVPNSKAAVAKAKPKDAVKAAKPTLAIAAKASVKDKPATVTAKDDAPKRTPQARVAIRDAGSRRAKPTWPAVELFAANLNERLEFRPYDALGRARKAAGSELARILRCWHTGKSHKIDARLGRALYEVSRHFPGHRVEIFSGYRPKAYCTRAHSRHLTGAAIDFRVAGVKNEALIAWLRASFHPAGVGYYPNGVHVHLDLDRTEDTYWVDRGDTVPSTPDVILPAIGRSAPEASVDESHGEPVVAMPDLPSPDEVDDIGFDPPMDDPAL